MAHKRVLTVLALLVAGTVALGGCGRLADDPDGQGAASGAEEASGEPPTREGPPFTREGFFGTSGFEARFAITALERREDRTVLRFTVTPLTEEGDTGAASALAADYVDPNPSGIHLVDPVGQRYYYPLQVATDRGARTLGSVLPGRVVGGAEYQVEAHFPRLPEAAERVSVLTPSTVGVFTGIPVTDAAPPYDAPGEEAPSHHDVEAGDTVVTPVLSEPLPEDPDRFAWDLYGVTEGGAQERDSSATEERIALRADVLFDFDEDALTDGADDLLTEISEEIRERADPDGAPITVVGHTDGAGSNDHNLDLSERRAEAVRERLEAALGDAYRFETESRGSAEPLAVEGGADDDEARARNRRVEISYPVGGSAGAPAEAADGQDAEARAGTVDAPPAAYLAEPLGAVETLTARERGHEYEMTVYPLRRDGAYLIAEFDLVHSGDSQLNGFLDDFDGVDYLGGDFTDFSVLDSGTGQVYRAVRVGARGEVQERTGRGADIYYLDPPLYPVLVEPDSLNRGYFYVPAPPEDVTEVTLDAGVFGAVADMPIE